MPIDGLYEHVFNLIDHRGVIDLFNCGLTDAHLKTIMDDLAADPRQKARVRVFNIGRPHNNRQGYRSLQIGIANTLIMARFSGFANLQEIGLNDLNLVRLHLEELPKLLITHVDGNPKLSIDNTATKAVTYGANVNQRHKFWPALDAPQPPNEPRVERNTERRPSPLDLKDSQDDDRPIFSAGRLAHSSSPSPMRRPGDTVGSPMNENDSTRATASDVNKRIWKCCFRR